MAIINNCLCVFSVWTGSYISGIYSLLYYSLHIILETLVMLGSDDSSPGAPYDRPRITPSLGREERNASSGTVLAGITTTQQADVDFRDGTVGSVGTVGVGGGLFVLTRAPDPGQASSGTAGNESAFTPQFAYHPANGSFIDYDSSTATFMITILFPAGIVASALLIAGMCWHKRHLLFPWLLLHPVITFIDFIEVLKILFGGKIVFSPLSVFLFSGYLFLTTINVYCFLCVLSQYQDFKAGRMPGSPTSVVRSTLSPMPNVNGSQRMTTLTSPSFGFARRGPTPMPDILDDVKNAAAGVGDGSGGAAPAELSNCSDEDVSIGVSCDADVAAGSQAPALQPPPSSTEDVADARTDEHMTLINEKTSKAAYYSSTLKTTPPQQQKQERRRKDGTTEEEGRIGRDAEAGGGTTSKTSEASSETDTDTNELEMNKKKVLFFRKH